MASVQDERGYNQGFKPTRALEVRTHRRVKYILEQTKNSDQLKILEIGCGTGEIATLLAENTGATVTGLDLSEKFISEAQTKHRRENLNFVSANFINSKAGQDLGSFDYVIGNGILHHLYYNLPDAFIKIRGLLRPNGKIIFLEPNIYNPYCFLIFKFRFFRRLAKLEPDEMAFSKGTIVPLLRQAGFTSINVSYKDFLLPNTPNFLIKPLCLLGQVFERIPLLRLLAQSIFISAETP